MTYAELVRVGLARKGMKAVDLAKAAGVSPSTVTRILAGESGGYADNVARINEVLDIDPDQAQRALLGYQPALPESRPLTEIIRELEVAARREAPIEIVRIDRRAAAGYLSGGAVEVETITYLPTPEQRGHDLFAVIVSGTCLEPRLMDGHTAIVDRSIQPRESDIVLALHEGEAVLKEYRTQNGRAYLVALQGPSPLPASEETRIVGVVVGAQYRP